MNKTIDISVKGYLYRFFKKMSDKNININNVKYLNNNEIICTVNLIDYNTIKKINYYSDIKIIKYHGIDKIKIHIKKYLFIYLLLFFCFILMDILTSYIVKIEIIHENSRIRQIVKRELESYNIKKYTLARTYDDLEKIKNKILKDNPNCLEWMSIKKVGMTYIVNVEERIINQKEKNIEPRNIIARKDALITKIINTKGESIVRSGDYVKKGDLLISGQINLYEEVKGYTAATGVVYGNVWYEADIKIPYEEEIIKQTGKKRYNININNKIFLKNKYRFFKQENKRELNILGIKIKIYQEKEYSKKTVKYTDKQLDLIAQQKIKETFIKQLKNKGTIINQKVLKKIKNNSKIEYRIFVVTNEIISEYENIEMSDENDPHKSS